MIDDISELIHNVVCSANKGDAYFLMKSLYNVERLPKLHCTHLLATLYSSGPVYASNEHIYI